MIDLLSVKLNNDYDFVQDSLPEVDGSWLCTEDSTDYKKGYSYQVVTGENAKVTRIESGKDYKIKNSIYSTIQLVCEYLNNFFPVDRQNVALVYDQVCSLSPSLSMRDSRLLYQYLAIYGQFTFSNRVISGIVSNPFKVGDLVQLNNSQRNNYFSYVTTSTIESITIDNELCSDTVENVLIALVSLPEQVQNIISQMVHYDIYLKDNINNLKSENIGNYSYSKNDVKIGGLYYPQEVITGLQTFKKVRFV